MESMTAASSQNFRFLALPTEIRMVIYRLVLPYSKYVEDLEFMDCPISWFKGTSPALLFGNRQTYREATEILYKENLFALYVRHPRAARLPMNESRADPESFVLISWRDRSWAHPRNSRLPLSVLRRHINRLDIRRLHVSLPPFDDLIGVDAFMRRSSYAGFHGISAWVRKCAKQGGCLDHQEEQRMAYVRKYKEPVDEIGDFIREMPRLDHLSISFQLGDFDITHIEYLIGEILEKREVGVAKCFYVVTSKRQLPPGERWDTPLLRRFEQTLQSPMGTNIKGDVAHLPARLHDMYWLLRAMRTRQTHENMIRHNDPGNTTTIASALDAILE